jgi:hypothetical protein
VLGASPNTITITAPAPAAPRVYTIPDAGGSTEFTLNTALQSLTNKTITDPTNNVASTILFSTNTPNGNPVTVNNGGPPAANYILVATSPTTASWQSKSSYLTGVFNTTILGVESIVRSTAPASPDLIAYFAWLNSEYSSFTNLRIVYDAQIAVAQKIVLDVYNITTSTSLGASGDITTSVPGSFVVTKPIANARLAVRGYKTGGARSTVISLSLLMDG